MYRIPAANQAASIERRRIRVFLADAVAALPDLLLSATFLIMWMRPGTAAASPVIA